MLDPERLALVAKNEGIELSMVEGLDAEIERIFGEDRYIFGRVIEDAPGLWSVNLVEKEPGVDMVRFERSHVMSLPEIESGQLLINRAYVGIGLRTVRATTETTAVIESDDEKTNENIKSRNRLSFAGINTVKVTGELEVDPRLLHYHPIPRSVEHVAQIVTGTTTLLKRIKT